MSASILNEFVVDGIFLINFVVMSCTPISMIMFHVTFSADFYYVYEHNQMFPLYFSPGLSTY